MDDQGGWQVFKLHDGDPQEAIDGRDPASLVYVGRLVKPDDGGQYWKPDETSVGERFGEGLYILFLDAMILEWDEPGPASFPHDVVIMLDVEAETRFRARTR